MRTLTWLPGVETPALIVREIEPHDWRAFSRFMLSPTYQRHIAMRFKDEDEVKAFVTRTVARQGDERRNVFHLAAEAKSTGETIGDGFIILQRKGLAELGWGVDPRHWHQGLGTQIGRALLGLSQAELGQKAGLQPSAISHFESRRRSPSFDNLRRLADALSVTLDFLLGRESEARSAGPVAGACFSPVNTLTETTAQAARARTPTLRFVEGLSRITSTRAS